MPPNKSSKSRVKDFIKLRKGLPPVDYKFLQKVCRAPVSYFKIHGDYGLTPGGPLIYKDNGSDVLAVAHLGIVEKARHFSTTKLSHDEYVNCPTLNGRMGAYTILQHLKRMDIVPDILLTTGGDKCQSTAMYFTPPKGKTYNWVFSFDNEGGDVALYEYFDWEMRTILERAGWKVNHGDYSCIAELEHMRVKGFNFGCGIEDAHSLDARVSLNTYLTSMKKFERFYKQNFNTHYPHLPKYNIWTQDEGFAFIHKPGAVPYQDTFTEEEIELIEHIDNDNLVPDHMTRITPFDIKETIHHRENIAKQHFVTEPSLFDDVGVDKQKNKEKETSKEQASGIKLTGEIELTFEETSSVVHPGSEDDPDGSLMQARKPDETVRVIHSDSEDLEKAIKLAEQEESKGKQTIGPTINSNQRENKSSNFIIVKPKGRVVSIIPLGKITEDEQEYDYIQRDDGVWEWRPVKRLKTAETELVF